jgi:hypothetical protein
MKKKNKKSSKKSAARKKQSSAKAKLTTRSHAKKTLPKRKTAARKKPLRESAVMGSQSVETVPLSAVRPKSRSARAGSSGGGGDYSGISVVEGADSESPRELIEEGQTFEAGIVDAVQNAPNADQGEVRTREVPEDDVPKEYDDQDRP